MKSGTQALVGVLAAAIVLGAAAWWREGWLKDEISALAVLLREKTYALTNATPLTAAQESALKPGETLPKECRDCPEMIVVPALPFSMGSPEGEGDKSERPQHPG